MIDANSAREKWLIERIPDIMGEIENKIKALVNDGREILSKNGEIVFDRESNIANVLFASNEITPDQKIVLIKYIEGLGYRLTIHEAFEKIVIKLEI
jgi:hypothetical protein